MSGVGAAGGAGGGGAVAPSSAGAGASDAVQPASGAPDSGDFSGGGDSVQAVGGDSASSSTSNSEKYMPPMCDHGQMNTQNFINLHNSSVQTVNQVNETDSSQLDLKKLIEMMLAIKLLQEMNKSP
jgi:hypothetical protein